MNDKFKKQKVFVSMVNVVDMDGSDKFADLGGASLAELLVEMEMSNLGMRDKLDLPEKTTFGMELEFENALYKRVQGKLEKHPEWKLHFDNSVMEDTLAGKIGGEISSPIMTDDPKNYGELCDVCDILQGEKAQAGPSAGGHIHIGEQILREDKNTLANFFKLWALYEPQIYRFAYGNKLGPRGVNPIRRTHRRESLQKPWRTCHHKVFQKRNYVRLCLRCPFHFAEPSGELFKFGQPPTHH
jgi:hypothetical protein